MEAFQIKSGNNTTNNCRNYKGQLVAGIATCLAQSCAILAQNGRLAVCTTYGDTQKCSKTNHRQTAVAIYINFPPICEPEKAVELSTLP